jgi:trigger factor
MKVEMEDLGGLKYRLTVVVDGPEFTKEKQKLARQYAPQMNLHGFRPGKAPIEMIMRQVGPGLEVEAKERLAARVLQEALDERKIKPSVEPQVEFEDDGEDGSVRFKAEFEALPVVDPKDYLGVTVAEPPLAEVTDEDVEKTIDQLRVSASRYDPKPEDGVACEKDMIVCSMVIRKAEGGEVLHERDESRIMCGVDDEPLKGIGREVLGLKAGESKTMEGEIGPIAARFLPAEEGAEEGAVRRAFVELTVKQVLAKAIPELNDELAKRVGGADSVEAWRQAVRTRIESDRLSRQKDEVREAVIAKIVEANPVEVGSGTVTRLANIAEKETRDRIFSYLPEEQREKMEIGVSREETEVEARRNLGRTLVIQAIADKENVEVTAEEFDARLQEIAAQTGLPMPKLRARLGGEDGDSLRRRMRLEKTIDMLARYAVVTRGEEAPAAEPVAAVEAPAEETKE